MSLKPIPKTIQLNPIATEHQRVLSGPPESVTMHSGCVVLQPASSVGKHSTNGYEELVVVLEGEGEMLIGDGSVLQLKPFVVAYCPPDTEHDVRNTGDKPLRYVYVVARVK